LLAYPSISRRPSRAEKKEQSPKAGRQIVAATEQVFAGDPRSPAAARRFVKSVIGELIGGPAPDPLCDDLELVVSELVTNAVRAGSERVGVAVSVEDDCVLVRVSDDAEGWPEPREADVDDIGGRGLPMVNAISTAWGVRPSGQGKVVWAELPIPGKRRSGGEPRR
jgi:anti-sigma regulatory factor (Ser/Thr protein kinase)